MSERFARYDFVSFSPFTPIEVSALSVVSNREVSRLHERPGQKGVAVFAVALAFFLAVTPPRTTHTPAIRRVVADFFEALHGTRFVQNRPCEYASNARECLQKVKDRMVFRLLMYGLFDAIDLL